MTRAKRFWSAVPKAAYEENLQVEDGKVYYTFHGSEVSYSESVGDIVRELVQRDYDEQFIVFKYVPVPSSMQSACWASLTGAHPHACQWIVRVHEKFEFPQLSRGSELTEPASPVPADTAGELDEENVLSDGYF